MAGFRDEMRATWQLWRPRRPVHITGDTSPSEPQQGITERLGIDEHRPVRAPERWKPVVSAYAGVWVDGKFVGKHALECPDDGTLVADVYGQERHKELLAVIRELLDRVSELERIVLKGDVESC